MTYLHLKFNDYASTCSYLNAMQLSAQTESSIDWWCPMVGYLNSASVENGGVQRTPCCFQLDWYRDAE